MRKIAFLFVLISNHVFSQTIEDYLSPAFPTELTASQDGKTIAWIFNDKGARNIFVAESPSFRAKRITNYEGD